MVIRVTYPASARGQVPLDRLYRGLHRRGGFHRRVCGAVVLWSATALIQEELMAAQGGSSPLLTSPSALARFFPFQPALLLAASLLLPWPAELARDD